MTKHITLLSLVILLVLPGFTSCKKNYTCTCTTTLGTVYNSEIKTTKKKATAFCSDQQTNGRTCVLK